MMAQMGGTHMGTGLMALCFLWTVLVAAALIGLVVLSLGVMHQLAIARYLP